MILISLDKVDMIAMSKARIRITIIGLNYRPESTGNAPYTASLAEGLAKLGHKVHVITGYPHYPEWSLRDGYTGWTRTETINGVSVTRLRHHVPTSASTVGRLHMELSFGMRVVLARWNSPDVVLVVSPALFSSALAILRVRCRPNRPAVAIWIQDLYSRGVAETGTGGGRVTKAATRVEALILKSADGVAAIHDRFKKYMIGALGVPAERVEVIRNWTHLPPAPTSGANDVRRRMGWGEDDVIVLHAGNMGKKQGLENVISAARIAEMRKSRVKFILMGDGNQRRHLEDLAAGLRHLEFVDPLPGEDFQRALAAADVLLVNELPGVRDMAVPSKLTSYFSAGVPVLAATDPESVTAYEVRSSGGGVVVSAADPEALVKAAELLSEDKHEAARLAANGLRFRHETLSEATAVAHYDELITSLATSRDR